MADTPRFALPWLFPGQAQKEMFHNEALARVDAVLHPAAQAVGATTPPDAPTVGQSWVLGAAPTGMWDGHGHALASWTEGGWRYAAPTPGMHVWSLADQVFAHWTGADWVVGQLRAKSLYVDGKKVVGARAAAIPAPAGGITVDIEARTAINALMAALSEHGLISR